MSKTDKQAAIEYLEQLLRIVRNSDVDYVEHNIEAHSVREPDPTGSFWDHRPDGWQTHTIKVRANVGVEAEAGT